MTAEADAARIVHVVDDDASLRTALGRVLRAAGFDVRGYASAVEFLDSRDKTSGCLVLDVGLPGMNGVELQAALARIDSSLPVVFLTGQGDIETSVRAMKAGAVDFLTKPVKRDALLAAIEAALAREAARRAQDGELRSLRTRFASLTVREREVFERVVHGRLNKQIANELGTSIRTVKAHRAQMMSKMEASSLAELVRAADRMQRGTHA